MCTTGESFGVKVKFRAFVLSFVTTQMSLYVDAFEVFSRIFPSGARAPHLSGRQTSRSNGLSTMSHLKKKILPLGTVLQSDTGRSYTIDGTLSERTKPLLSVYRARYVMCFHFSYLKNILTNSKIVSEVMIESNIL